MIACCMGGWSSATISVAATAKPHFFRISATAGPERSARSLRDAESLTVRTAAVRTSGVEEDIFLFFLGAAVVTLGFVEHAQAFHQQALGVECGSLFFGFAFEVNLATAAGPAQDFEDRLL